MAKHPEARVIDLGLRDYQEVHQLQLETVSRHIGHPETRGDLLVVEHPPVFTLGKRGGIENLILPEESLQASGVPVVQTERGGNITFHGPGQVVLYPILSLEALNLGVKGFVHLLEETMILTCQDLGVNAARRSENHGIWVDTRKIGSVGLCIRHGVTFHGLALNVNPDLTFFSWINPCGLKGFAMTSIAEELKQVMHPSPDIAITNWVSMAKASLVNHLADLCGLTIVSGREEGPV